LQRKYLTFLSLDTISADKRPLAYDITFQTLIYIYIYIYLSIIHVYYTLLLGKNSRTFL